MSGHKTTESPARGRYVPTGKSRAPARTVIEGTRGDAVWSQSDRAPFSQCWSLSAWNAWVQKHQAKREDANDR